MNKEYQEALDILKYHYENPRRHYFNMGANEPHKYFNTLQEAVDKANKYDDKETPKKPIIQGLGQVTMHYCPNCKKELILTNDGIVIYKTKTNYCEVCGQHIDWNDE